MKAVKNKPCSACPWISKEARDVKATSQPVVVEAMQRGDRFCCHVNMGTCHGAALRHAAHMKASST